MCDQRMWPHSRAAGGRAIRDVRAVGLHAAPTKHGPAARERAAKPCYYRSGAAGGALGPAGPWPSRLRRHPHVVNTGQPALSLGCCGARAYLDVMTDDVALWAATGEPHRRIRGTHRRAGSGESDPHAVPHVAARGCRSREDAARQGIPGSASERERELVTNPQRDSSPKKSNGVPMSNAAPSGRPGPKGCTTVPFRNPVH